MRLSPWLAAIVVAVGGHAFAETVDFEEVFRQARERMVTEQLVEARDGRALIRDERVLQAMRRVPRHEFVPGSVRGMAYEDHPLPIGEEQTISQPYIVALMTELAEVAPGDRVLEIGTGSGYQAAVLAELTDQVYSIEIIDSLARLADERLTHLGYEIHVRSGDGYLGWPEASPFEAIIVTAAAPRLPERLIEQLAVGGRLVIPLGKTFQQLQVFRKTPEGVEQVRSIPVRFVPMTGLIQEAPDGQSP